MIELSCLASLYRLFCVLCDDNNAVCVCGSRPIFAKFSPASLCKMTRGSVESDPDRGEVGWGRSAEPPAASRPHFAQSRVLSSHLLSFAGVCFCSSCPHTRALLPDLWMVQSRFTKVHAYDIIKYFSLICLTLRNVWTCRPLLLLASYSATSQRGPAV